MKDSGDDYETRFYVKRFGDPNSKYHVVSREPVATDDPGVKMVVYLDTEKAVAAMNELSTAFAALASASREFGYALPKSLRSFYGALALIVGLLVLLLWVAL